jgi:Transposase IS66 family
LTRFLDDGRIKLDNSRVERSIRLSSSTGKMHSSQASTAAPSDVDPLA